MLSSKTFLDSRQKYLKETWLSGINDYVFVSDFENHDNICVTQISDYSSGEIKTINFLKHIVSKCKFADYDWFFICDDDTFINRKRFFDVYSSLVNDKYSVYGKIINKESDPFNPIWAKRDDITSYLSGGAGYFISRHAANKIVNSDLYDKVPITGFGDVTIGLLFKNSDLKLCNVPNMFTGNEHQLSLTTYEIKNCITMHHIKTLEHQKKLYDITKCA